MCCYGDGSNVQATGKVAVDICHHALLLPGLICHIYIYLILPSLSYISFFSTTSPDRPPFWYRVRRHHIVDFATMKHDNAVSVFSIRHRMNKDPRRLHSWSFIGRQSQDMALRGGDTVSKIDKVGHELMANTNTLLTCSDFTSVHGRLSRRPVQVATERFSRTIFPRKGRSSRRITNPTTAVLQRQLTRSR